MPILVTGGAGFIGSHLCDRAVAGRGDTRIRNTGGDRGWPGDVPKIRYDTSRLQALGWQPSRAPRKRCESRLSKFSPMDLDRYPCAQ
jgi:nucleoside-diphosphate-sugar epimerase